MLPCQCVNAWMVWIYFFLYHDMPGFVISETWHTQVLVSFWFSIGISQLFIMVDSNERSVLWRFIIGFFLAAIPWYVGAIILLCVRSVDYREKPGYIACTVAVSSSYLSFLFNFQSLHTLSHFPRNWFCSEYSAHESHYISFTSSFQKRLGRKKHFVLLCLASRFVSMF